MSRITLKYATLIFKIQQSSLWLTHSYQKNFQKVFFLNQVQNISQTLIRIFRPRRLVRNPSTIPVFFIKDVDCVLLQMIVNQLLIIHVYYSQINSEKRQDSLIIKLKMNEKSTSLLLSSYYIINTGLVIVYPILRLYTSAGDRDLRKQDPFGFTYENSVIYTILVLAIIAFVRSTSIWQFYTDLLTLGKICVLSLLYFAKFRYCIYYLILCIFLWFIIPYPRYRSKNKFIKIESEEHFDEILQNEVISKQDSKHASEWKKLGYNYRDKKMFFVQFEADWALTCQYTKQIWNKYSNIYTTDKLRFLSVNVDRVPELAGRFKINSSGFSKQLPTVLIIQNGQEINRFPPVDKKTNKVSKVAKYDYKTLLRYFDLQSRYLETKD